MSDELGDSILDEMMRSVGLKLCMQNLSANIANAARCQYAYDLGWGTQGSWWPGCGKSVHVLRFSCEWCGEIFEGDPKTKQAYRCAAATFQRRGEWYLEGYYGSCVADMAVFKFRDGFYNLDAPADPVCDACITRMINCHDLWFHGYGEP